MFSRYDQKQSYLISFAFHVLLTLAFLFVDFTIEAEDEEYVTIGFGSGSVGNLSSEAPKKQVMKTQPKKDEVELPAAKNPDEENVVAETKKEETKEPEQTDLLNKSEEDYYGLGDGSFGYDIDFGGKRVRKVYSYNIPPYPEGVSKEIDVRLRFTILPDGSVGSIFPLIKADSRLEEAAIKSLRQWRFEPLTGNQRNQTQTAVIIFPFRLQ
jgi:protein TonB